MFAPLCAETRALFAPITIHTGQWLDVSLHRERGQWSFQCEWSVETQGGIRYNHTRASLVWLNRIIEKTVSRDTINRVLLPCTDLNAMFLALWPTKQRRLTSEAQEVYDHLRTRWLVEGQYVQAVARFQADGTLPNWKYRDSKDLPLTPHQQISLFGAMRSEGFALFMEQGVGKTAPVICRINNESQNYRSDRMYRALIVVPASVRTNWVEELIRFSTVRGKAVILAGDAISRVKLLTQAFTPTDASQWVAVIVSYDTLVSMWPTLRSIDWDLGVLDESHYIKSASAKRTKHILGWHDRKGQYFEGLRDRCRQRMVLTGTPYTNSHTDLWTQLEFLYEGGSGFASRKKFTQYYGRFINVNGQSKMIALRNLPLLQERLARCASIVTKKEALPNLPEKTYDILDVEMEPAQSRYYRKLAGELAAWSEDHLERGELPRSILITNVLTKMLRLSQVTSGFINWDAEVDPSGEVVVPAKLEHFKKNPKLDALVEQLHTLPPDEKAIVWACWVPAIEAILERLKTEGIPAVGYYGRMSMKQREASRRAINGDPDCKVFVSNPDCGGIGLNLLGYSDPSQTTNVARVFYFVRNWKPTPSWQSEDRSHRMGTRVPQRYTDICVPGTIDMEVRRALKEKRTRALQMQDLRDIITRLREF